MKAKREKWMEAAELERAQVALKAAQASFDLRLRRAFRAGDLVTVYHARPFEAEVVEVDGIDTLAVRNTKTGTLRRRIAIVYVTTDHYRGEYVRNGSS